MAAPVDPIEAPEPQDADERAERSDRRRSIISFSLSSVLVLIIVIPLVSFGTWLAIDHANANQERQARHQRALTEQRFREGLKLLRQTTAYSVNKSVCVLQTISEAQIGRLNLTKPKGYVEAIRFWQQIIDNQVPIPADFDCKDLNKLQPPPPAP